MATGRDSSTGAQDRPEKKDHPRRDGEWRGSEHDRDADDAEDRHAKGARNMHSEPGRKHEPEPSTNPPGDGNQPGGNRPKTPSRGEDHN